MNFLPFSAKLKFGMFFCLLAISAQFGCQADQLSVEAISDKPIPVKFVLVTMFEIGEDEGDQAGEFQLWKERQNLSVRIPFPQSHHDLL